MNFKNTTTAQTRMILRARTRDIVSFEAKQVAKLRAESAEMQMTELRGSGDFKTARNLQSKGFGRVVSFMPIDKSFFKLENDSVMMKSA